jgi:hypothetical protein
MGGAAKTAITAGFKAAAGPIIKVLTGTAGTATGQILPTPKVASNKLQNIINDLYKGTTNPNRIGMGTTADAIRNEVATQQPTFGKFHITKGRQYSRALENWLKANRQAA